MECFWVMRKWQLMANFHGKPLDLVVQYMEVLVTMVTGSNKGITQTFRFLKSLESSSMTIDKSSRLELTDFWVLNLTPTYNATQYTNIEIPDDDNLYFTAIYVALNAIGK